MSADLISRIESADGPDRGGDAEIAAAVRYFPKNGGFVWKNDLEPNCPEVGRVTCVTSLGTGGPHYESPRYTASIDAALTLVPEGWSYVIRPGYVGLRHPRNPENDVTSWANDAALALAAAVLKARGV